jgi:hypothetical protein
MNLKLKNVLSSHAVISNFVIITQSQEISFGKLESYLYEVVQFFLRNNLLLDQGLL